MTNNPGKAGNAQDALAPVIGYIREQLESSMGVFLDRAHKTLNDAWPGIPEFRKQDHARYTANWLQTNKPRILSALHLRLIGALNVVPEEHKMPEELGELRLMDADALSAHLIRSRMVSRVMERGRNDLAALEMRFEEMQRRGAVINGRALAPGALADGLLNSLKDLQVPAEVQALILDIYGDQGVKLLVDFYRGINQLLAEHGVLPDLKISPRVSSFQPRAGAVPSGDAAGAGAANAAGNTQFDPSAGAEMPAPTDARAQIVQQLLEQVSRGDWQPGLFRQLLDWQFTQAGATGAAGSAAMPVAPGGRPAHAATQAIAASLGGDAGVQVPGVPVAVTVDAIRDLAGLLSPMIFVDPRSLSQEQTKAVDKLESQSFELLRDEKISPRVRAELSRLIPALLSAQLSYPGTFGAPDNSPRVFIRQLALLGYRDQEFPLANFEAVHVVVDRILAEEGREVESFRTGADVLYTLARQEVKRRIADAAGKRTKSDKPAPSVEAAAVAIDSPAARSIAPVEPAITEAVESINVEDLAKHEQDAFIAESRHQVALELSDRAAGLELAPPAVEFLKRIVGPWMMARYQKFGANSPQWRDARAFATRYFEAIQPAVDAADQSHKETLRTRVILEARLHAQRATLPPAESTKLATNLERHLQSLGIVTGEEQRARATARNTPIDFLRDLPRALA